MASTEGDVCFPPSLMLVLMMWLALVNREEDMTGAKASTIFLYKLAYLLTSVFPTRTHPDYLFQNNEKHMVETWT